VPGGARWQPHTALQLAVGTGRPAVAGLPTLVWLSWSSGSLLTMVGRLEGAMPGAGGLAGLLITMDGLAASVAAGCCWSPSCAGAAGHQSVQPASLAAVQHARPRGPSRVVR
jgi:hypothetical protein